MALTKIELRKFTAFDSLAINFSPGINVFIGANGSGKTHLLKALYAACDISKTKIDFAEKLIGVFLPHKYALGRLVRRQGKSAACVLKIFQNAKKLEASFSNHAKDARASKVSGAIRWNHKPIESVYIPVKEMLANAPGFRSLYTQREIHFEAIYADILDRAYLPVLYGPVDRTRKRLLAILEESFPGKVKTENETFFLHNTQGNLEFTLLAEGMRKLGLLWLLIKNGTLTRGSVLFWDEPETNLNPRLFGPLIEILLELQRIGVQIFLATHDYVILKELDLGKKPKDDIRFHSLFQNDAADSVHCHSTTEYLEIHPNAIQETFLSLYDRDVRRDLEASAGE